MTNEWPGKYGDEVLDYEWDWTARLEEGEEVLTVAATIRGGTGLAIDEEETTAGVTTLWISGGGTRAATGTVNLLAETNAGRELGAKIKLPILAR